MDMPFKKKKKKFLEKVSKLGEKAKEKLKESKAKADEGGDALTKALRNLTTRDSAPIRLDDSRTLNQTEKAVLDKTAKRYITALTSDCPMDCIILCGIDFPKFVQPIKPDARGRVELHLNARPQELKKSMIPDKMLEKIIEDAYNTWVPVTVPTGMVDEKTGEREYLGDAMRAINFIVLQPVVEGAADPGFDNLQPLSKRSKEIRKLIAKHHEFQENRDDVTFRTTKDGKREKVVSV